MTLRRAIDPSGSLGSLYDRYQDCTLKRSSVATTASMHQLFDPIRCELIDGNKRKSQNLLEMIGIDGDVRLNILLNSTPRTGIAAIVDHPRPTDNYTRFLYIFYADREQRLPDDATKARQCFKSLLRDANATHVITAVSFGIDVVVVLQLPNKDNTARKIDRALDKIRASLENNNDVFNLTTDGDHALEKIIETKAYSNVSELTKMTSLLEICQYITGLKKKSDIYRPLTYTLQPIEWLYPDAHKICTLYIPLEKYANDKLEQHLIEILEQMKKIKHKLDSVENKQLFDPLKESLLKAKSEWQNLQQAYESAIESLRELVSDIHSGQKNASEIDKALEHNDQIKLKEDIRKLLKELNELDTLLIDNSQQQQFEHDETYGHQVNQNGDEETLEDEPIAENQQNKTLHSNERMTDNNQSTTSTEPKKERKRNRQSSSSSSSEKQTSNTKLPTSTDEIINVLLLGESGVGKSTFINAFVNYLIFKTLNQAESGKPVVLIPVSFLLTVGDHFEERIINFGDSDNFNNEDFDHPGQSVTQHCKSYLFKLNHCGGRRIRIIDTPGFGDTRGVAQDDLNMQHILEYINNLKQLNAICFLLKPNVSQIHNFFQNYLTQILDILGPDFCQNIIFCFTNSRSTFYTPGDTAPLLKRILKSLSTDAIPFNKRNTFCFDNESFRYLVALQKSIEFDDHDKEEYENSWSKSVNESNRLLNYVCAELSAFPKQTEWQSIKHAQLQITYMVRPMLEAIRNILRNMIIYNTDAPRQLIELIPKALCRPAAVCFTCERDSSKKGIFWIIDDVPHEIQKKCYFCKCALSQHMPIYYKLEYKALDGSCNCNEKEMKKELNLLRNASVEFAYFLIHVARSSEDDPFFIGMTQIIGEENNISKRENAYTNERLAEKLRDLLHKYEQRMDMINSNQHSKLSVIYELIQTICEHPMVKIQMAAIRKTQEAIMKLYEYEVPENLTSTSVH